MLGERDVNVVVYPHKDSGYARALSIYVNCGTSASSMAQIFNALRQVFSAVEHLTLEHKTQDTS